MCLSCDVQIAFILSPSLLFLLQVWARLHGFLPRAFDVLFIIIFSVYHLVTHALVLRVAFVHNAPFVASVTLCMEQVGWVVNMYVCV